MTTSKGIFRTSSVINILAHLRWFFCSISSSVAIHPPHFSSILWLNQRLRGTPIALWVVGVHPTMELPNSNWSLDFFEKQFPWRIFFVIFLSKNSMRSRLLIISKMFTPKVVFQLEYVHSLGLLEKVSPRLPYQSGQPNIFLATHRSLSLRIQKQEYSPS